MSKTVPIGIGEWTVGAFAEDKFLDFMNDGPNRAMLTSACTAGPFENERLRVCHLDQALEIASIFRASDIDSEAEQISVVVLVQQPVVWCGVAFGLGKRWKLIGFGRKKFRR